MYKLIVLLAVSSLLFACSSDGKLKVINRTGHEIYFNVKGNDYTIEGSSDVTQPNSKSVSLDAGSDFINTPSKTYLLEIDGETFAIYNEEQQTTVPSTEVTINGGETTNVYCDPNYACLRIYNNNEQDVIAAYYTKSYQGIQIPISEAENISPGDSIYKRLQYSLEIAEEPEDIFYYTFRVVMQDSTNYYYGNSNTILYLDDLYEINIE
ncbi:MAG: hypothetical protein RAO94_02765 [Candidatus Stygibacter australis]|nr:hypothetical protein [Candidatus Stygibacter australis]MDP8321255.1 hypothetical protein [Candidatus Stygibacter australis]